MKIRKNKKLHLLRYFKNREVHYCQLNQSSRDLITPPNRGSAPSPPPQLRRGINFAGTSSLGGHDLDSKIATDEDSDDSLNPDEKVAVEMMTKLVVESPDMNKSDKGKVEEKFEFKLKKPTKIHGSDIASSSKTKRVVEEKKLPEQRRSKRAKEAKGASAPAAKSNSFDFYYYTGFGPSWGKKRRGEGNVVNNVEENANGSNRIVEYLEFNEEENDYEEGGKKKKMKKKPKKPKKKKSLKSLMREAM